MKLKLDELLEMHYRTDAKLHAINWNKKDDEMADMYWDQGVAQMWLPEEFDISRDLNAWETLTEVEKDTYQKVLAGLTGLDTKQSGEGMSLIAYHEPRDKYRANFSFMGMMEAVHARSYSYIFTTLITNKQTDDLLGRWVEGEEHLTKKAQYIGYFYDQLLRPNPSVFLRYMAKVASTFLESGLFYSGFYYPLYLAGQGKMTQSGAVIYKITQDEAYHGAVVGDTAQKDYQLLTKEEQELADDLTMQLLDRLYENEVSYTHKLYDELGLTEDVLNYVQYNFNRALLNLGKEAYFDPKPFNPIVENQTNVNRMRNVDFFSGKADYEKSIYIVTPQDKDFDFTASSDSELADEFL